MDNFCGSDYWDWDLTWNTNSPIFTTCFLKIALIWGPCIFFWIFVPIEVYFVVKSKEKKVPWSALNIMKLMTVFLILVLSAVDMIYQVLNLTKTDVHPVDYYTPFILFLTMAAEICISLWMRQKGVITSGVLFLFWLFLCLGTAISYYVAMQKTFNNVFDYDKDYGDFQFTTCVLYFGFSLIEVLLHCFADMRMDPHDIPERENPEDRASFLSKLTFWWFNPMAVLGYKKPLTSTDMWVLNEANQSEYLQMKFNKYWLPLVEFVKNHHHKLKASLSKRYSMKDSSLPTVTVSPSDSVKDIPTLSILKPIIKTFGCEFFYAGLLKVAGSVITFANPILLDSLIGFVSSDEPYWRGFCYALGMFFAALLESFLLGQYEYKIYIIAMKIRSCTISVIYKKALTLSIAARKNFTVGEVVNLMAVDTQRVMDYVQMAFLLLSAPIQIGISIYLLWQQLGIATLGGLAVMFLMIPINGVISVFIRNYQVLLMKDKDRRTKLMNEILNGIKVLKLYAWENSFIREVMNIRNKEVASLRSQAYMNGAITFAFSSVPYLVSLASFATFVLIDSNNILDANRAFVSLSLFNILRVPTALLPMVITYTAMFVVSLKRINQYLQSDEIDPSFIDHDPAEKDPVVIEDGTFSWTNDDEPALTNLNFRVKEGSLIAVVGQVGAGKSSLLAALLGEMVKLSGKVNVNGSVAYVPQQAWIQNATLRKNVLFNKSYNSKPYKEALDACALLPDLEILPGGDQTEIGEKGINLSGGQKQRVSLARAVYNDADIYYFDDPLSAVDVHVGKHIFEKVIGPQGVLKKKTRILVTHRISVLPEVDTIIVLTQGKISDIGSYKELLAKKGAFADFLIQYLEENVADSADMILPDEMSLIEEIAATVGVNPEITRQISKRSDGGSDSDSGTGPKMSRTKSLTSPEQGDGIRKRALSRKESSTPDSKLKTRAMSVSEKQSKLIDKETMEVGSVKAAVYWDYIQSYGLWNFLWTVICYGFQTAFSLGSSLWLSAWSNDALDPQKALDTHVRDVRLGVYGGLGGGEICFTLISSILMNLSCLRASKILHDGMLRHVMRAPMSFFDTTPLGRILNRFSKDIDTTDVTIRFNFRMLMIQATRAISAIIIISLETPFMILACLPLAVVYYFLQILHDGMLRHIMRAPMSFFDTTPLGRILNRFSKDIDTADVTIRFNIRMLLSQATRAISAIIIISLETPFFILACLPLAVVYYFLQKFYIPTSRQLKRLESTTRSPIYSHFSETVTGASCIRAFRAERAFMLYSNELVDTNNESYYTSLGASRWLSIRLEFLGYSIVFIAALFAVLARDTLSPGIAGLSVSYALQITGILNMLVRATADVETNIVSVERCLEYTKTPTEAEWTNEKTKPEPSWPDKGNIDFDRYSTRYREGLDLVLKGITCNVKSNERCGIVGRTGAGKSSLTLALFRIIEAAGGKILIDGEEIAKLGLHELRSKLTIIPQDPVLFTGSLRMNLDPFESYSDSALWTALEHAHLKDFVKSLEKGLEHEISEGGENLSVGQRQLICLARALLRKSKILVLDEATAAVDVETDELIQSTIRTEFDDCTVLTIAHRLNTIIDYDKVIVLDKGEIKEMDSPDNLLKDEKSIFYAMAKDAGLI